MNRYESILLDKMVELRNEENNIAGGVNDTDVVAEMVALREQQALLLDCICAFREPPRGVPVEEGHGAMVVVE